MSLIQKKDDEDREYIEGVEVIGRGDTPDDLEETKYKVEKGRSAEDISGKTARRAAEGALETEPDPNLVGDDRESAYYEWDDEGDDDGSKGGAGRTAIWIVILIIAVIVSVIVGYFFGISSSGSSVSSTSEVSIEDSDGSDATAAVVSSAYVTDDELDHVMATWTYGGEEHSITVREAIESEYSLDAVVLDDGTYAVPSADTVLSYVRNLILLDAAEDAGISVSEDEVDEYTADTLGSSDYEDIADTYGVTEEHAEEIMTEMATINALYESVLDFELELPDEPTEPDDGDEDTASEEYAAYIIELAGDEWDVDAGTWASEDGPYYEALGEEDFTEDSATYGQALMAYYVAYEEWYEAYSEASYEWLDYENELFSEAEITIYGLYE